MIIPTMDFRGQKFVNPDGTLSEVAQNFLDALQSLMNTFIGEEGVVMPTQTASNITVIQNNTQMTPNGVNYHTCAYGTLIYDSTDNTARVALNNGSNAPIFKTITTS